MSLPGYKPRYEGNARQIKMAASAINAAEPLVKEFKNVSVIGPLDIQLSVANGTTMINGLELILEE